MERESLPRVCECDATVSLVQLSTTIGLISFPKIANRTQIIARGNSTLKNQHFPLTSNIAVRNILFAKAKGNATNPEEFGGRDRDRTCDLMLAKHALSQLSYTPTVVTTSILEYFSPFAKLPVRNVHRPQIVVRAGMLRSRNARPKRCEERYDVPESFSGVAR